MLDANTFFALQFQPKSPIIVDWSGIARARVRSEERIGFYTAFLYRLPQNGAM
jgi:hypothetical protein